MYLVFVYFVVAKRVKKKTKNKIYPLKNELESPILKSKGNVCQYLALFTVVLTFAIILQFLVCVNN